LHDVGKIEARIGTVSRVVATVAAVVLGRENVVGWAPVGPDCGEVAEGDVEGRAEVSRRDRLSGAARRSIRHWQARVGRYLMHDSIGARLLEEAGSDLLTVSWAREHHLPESRWSVERHLGIALKEADGD